MRLTLRTLLAYLDDTLDAAEIKRIGQKVQESETARELIARIKTVTRRRRLTTPPLTGSGDKFDPNTVAEYLDNTLSPEQVEEVEKLCLESDVHLAEIAACHQILTLVLGEPALVPPSARRRMVALVDKGWSSGIRRAAPAATAAGVVRSQEDNAEDDALLLGLPALGRSQGAWVRVLLPIGACLLLVGLVAAIYMLLPGNEDVRRHLGGRDSGKQLAANNPPKQDTPIGEGDGKKGSAVAEEGKKQPDQGSDVKKPGDGDATTPPVRTGDDVKPAGNKPPVWSAAPPNSDPNAVGKFIRNNALQDAVLQSKGGTAEWQRVVSGSPVSSGDMLVSLPGYRGEVELNNGIHLVLWGNVPQQLSEWPILESAVVLHKPQPDKEGGVSDLDCTLSRGRIWITNQKKDSQPGYVRLRFHGEIWDLTLQPAAEIGVELIGRETTGFKAVRADEEPSALLGIVFKKGKASLRDALRNFPMIEAPAVFTWSNFRGSMNTPEPLTPWPEYWEQPVQIRMGVQGGPEMERALNALQKRLTENRPIGNLLAEALNDTEGPAGRYLAVNCASAIDAIDDLAEWLAHPRPDVRDDAVEALRHWLGRGLGQRERFRALLDKKYKNNADVEMVLQLLRIPSGEDFSSPDTYRIPIEQLASDNAALSHLAYWHLQRLASKELSDNPQLRFDPLAPKAKREAVQKIWRKMLDDEKLPPKEVKRS
jgi:hypothetical protein